MTTTTPTAISLLYLILSVLIVAALQVFAGYDFRSKRVPNRGLALFIPLVAAALPVKYLYEQQTSVLLFIGFCVAGTLAGGGILLAAALASHGGIGGGDIKLCALIGLFYGPYEMLFILLLGTPAAFIYGLLVRRKTGNKALHIAFVPFIAMGALLLTLFKMKGVLLS